jgi:hypothetical protein
MGIRLGLGGALGVYLVVCLSGLAVAVLGQRRSGGRPAPMGTDSSSTRRSA